VIHRNFGVVKIFLVEDDLSFSIELEMKIKEIGYEVVGKSQTYGQALLDISTIKPDIIICDVKLDEGKNGVDLAKQLSHLKIPMVFVSAYSEEKTYNAIKDLCSKFKYLVKPFDKLSLKSILDDLYEEKETLYAENFVRGEYLFIKKNNVFEKIKLADIKYFSSEGNYSTIVLPERKYLIKFSLSKLLKLNKFSHFLRVHRNYAVRANSITSVDFSQREIKIGDETLPFGRTYTKDIRSVMDMPFSGS